MSASAVAVLEPVPASGAVADSALFRSPTSVAVESGEGWYGSELYVVHPMLVKGRPAPPQRPYQLFRWDASLVAALVERQREHSAWQQQGYAPMLPRAAEPIAYQLFVSQLLPRGLTYEPAALGLYGADGCWRALRRRTSSSSRLANCVSCFTHTTRHTHRLHHHYPHPHPHPRHRRQR